MNDGLFRRWANRSGRLVRITLPFSDIMEIALALLGLSPSDLAKLGWTFEDRKRLINHLLASGKEAERMGPSTLDHVLLAVRFPAHDLHLLRCFAQRELPKRATQAAVIERLDWVLGNALSRL